jgi:hypothetical protein
MTLRGIAVAIIAIVVAVAMDSMATGTSYVSSATSGPRSLNVKTYERGASVTISVEVTDGQPTAYLVQDFWHAAQAGEGCENESPVLVRCPFNKRNVWVTLDGRRSHLRLFGDLRTHVRGTDGSGVLGGEGEDFITTNNGLASGLRGRDVLTGAGGDDLLLGGGNADRLLAGAGSDDMDGGSGRDILAAGLGEDYVIGGAAADIVRAGAGDDEVVANDNFRDKLIDCGPGDDDRAAVDRHLDRNVRGCETVYFR